MSAKHMEERNKSSKLTKIILFILICIFIYSSIQVIIWIKGNIELNILENGLYNEIAVDNKDTGTTQIDFERLQSINNDIIGWIKIPNTNINYPILKGETDEYYLRKDIYKNYNFSGSIFVDSSTDKEFSDDNTVIYGHNLKNGKMFSQLTRIYNGELEKNVDIEIYSNNNIKRYKVISAYLGEQDLSITQKKFSEVKQKESFIDNTISKSNIQFDYTKDYSKKIVTLVTCDKTGNKRIIVTGIEN